MSDLLGGTDRRDNTRFLDRVFIANLFVAELAMVFMVGLICLEIFLRSVFGHSLQFADEVAAYLLVVITFLGFSASVRGGAMYRVEFMRRLVPPRGLLFLEVVLKLLSLGFALILTYHLSALVLSSFERDVLSQTLLRTPQYIPQLVMPIGMGLLVISIILLIVEDIDALIRGNGVCEKND